MTPRRRFWLYYLAGVAVVIGISPGQMPQFYILAGLVVAAVADALAHVNGEPVYCNPYPPMWGHVVDGWRWLASWYWACVPHRTKPLKGGVLFSYYICTRCHRAVPAPSTSNEAA